MYTKFEKLGAGKGGMCIEPPSFSTKFQESPSSGEESSYDYSSPRMEPNTSKSPLNDLADAADMRSQYPYCLNSKELNPESRCNSKAPLYSEIYRDGSENICGPYCYECRRLKRCPEWILSEMNLKHTTMPYNMQEDPTTGITLWIEEFDLSFVEKNPGSLNVKINGRDYKFMFSTSEFVIPSTGVIEYFSPNSKNHKINGKTMSHAVLALCGTMTQKLLADKSSKCMKDCANHF